LFKAKESLGGTLVTLHNVQFMNDLMADIRGAIAYESGIGQAPIAAHTQQYSGNNVVRNHRRTLVEVEDEYVHKQLREFA